MELKDIQTLMQKFEDSDMRELNIDDGDFHLYLSKNKQARPVKPAAAEHPATNSPAPAKAPAESATAGKTITAPLVGTVYLQPKPAEPAYVSVGDHVKKGDVVCVIEAMKMMTEIKSDYTGIITKVNVSNEELVEVEQPLFTVSED